MKAMGNKRDYIDMLFKYSLCSLSFSINRDEYTRYRWVLGVVLFLCRAKIMQAT